MGDKIDFLRPGHIYGFLKQYTNKHPMLYTAKFRLVRLCPVFKNPVTYTGVWCTPMKITN